jgi:5-formyltetrahydrofolate cyclo-ligase
MTESDVHQLKAGIRREMRARMASFPSGERALLSCRACAILSRQPEWLEARTVMLFSPLPDEIDVSPLIQAGLAGGKNVCLPRFNKQAGVYEAARIQHASRDLAPGKMGIAEPVESCPALPLNLLDFCLASGVAFDLEGRRLGRGRGYYDRIFAEMQGIKCGAAWDDQILTSIPMEPHDQVLDRILTPARWIDSGVLSA